MVGAITYVEQVLILTLQADDIVVMDNRLVEVIKNANANGRVKPGDDTLLKWSRWGRRDVENSRRRAWA